MKTLPISNALERLGVIRERFRTTIRTKYEPSAKDCLTCEVMGECCNDEHFVNVRVTTLEAQMIRSAVSNLDEERKSRVFARCSNALEDLRKRSVERGSAAGYSCPLFEPGEGCLVHETAKPLPCISHACYERKEDLPPDSLLNEAETEVARLNSRVYGNAWYLEPIPYSLAEDTDTGS